MILSPHRCIFFLCQMSFLLSSPTFYTVSSHCPYFNPLVLVRWASTLPLTGALPRTPHSPHPWALSLPRLSFFIAVHQKRQALISSPRFHPPQRLHRQHDQSPMAQCHPSKAHRLVPALRNDLHSFWFYKKTNHVEYLRWDGRRKMVSDSVLKSNQEREGTPAREALTLPGDTLDGRHCSRLTFFTQEIVNSGSELRAALELWFLHCSLSTSQAYSCYICSHRCTHSYTLTHGYTHVPMGIHTPAVHMHTPIDPHTLTHRYTHTHL